MCCKPQYLATSKQVDKNTSERTCSHMWTLPYLGCFLFEDFPPWPPGGLMRPSPVISLLPKFWRQSTCSFWKSLRPPGFCYAFYIYFLLLEKIHPIRITILYDPIQIYLYNLFWFPDVSSQVLNISNKHSKFSSRTLKKNRSSWKLDQMCSKIAPSPKWKLETGSQLVHHGSRSGHRFHRSNQNWPNWDPQTRLLRQLFSTTLASKSADLLPLSMPTEKTNDPRPNLVV